MHNPSQPTTLERKIEFLKTVIEAAEQRRDSLDNRFSVLIASNAILLSVIIGLGLPAIPNNTLAYWLQIGLTIVALVSVILSAWWSVQTLIPVSSQKARSRIMDVGKDPKSERNLYLFLKIADFKKDEYRQEITSLSELDMFEQFLSEAHNLSRLLNHRYKVIGRAHVAFALGLGAFATLALTKLFE